MSTLTTKTIKVDNLARVEGEGALTSAHQGRRHRGGRVAHLRAAALLRGLPGRASLQRSARHHGRICGICPVAYQMSSVYAMEDALGCQDRSGPIRELRRLLYCGEWIESHVLHAFMLHAPDFLGYPGRDPDGRRSSGHRRARAGTEEDRQRHRGAAGRARDPPDQRARGRLLSPAQAQGVDRPDRKAQGRARDRAGSRAVDGPASLPGLRTGLRVCLAAPSRRVPLLRGQHRLQPGSRHSHPGLRRSLHRGACQLHHIAALDHPRPGQLPSWGRWRATASTSTS